MDDWEVTILRTFEEIESIQYIWEQMQHNEPSAQIDADYDRYFSVLKAAGDNVQPYIILIKQKGHLKTIVIARTETRQIACRIGYLTILKPRMHCLSVVYGGILGQPDNEVCSFLVNELLRILRSREIDMVFFSHLKMDSYIYQLSKKLPNILSRDYFPNVEKHFCMSIPENLEQFYMARSQKHRARLKRYVKRLEKEYPNSIKMITYSQEADLDEAIKAASGISRSTYQYGLGCGFTDDSKTRNLLTTVARRGWLRLHILYINNEPCAFENWFQYNKAYVGHGIGFDPKWRKWRIGTILFLKTIERLSTDPTADLIDFGFGDAEYKRNYADIKWQEASICIFAPRFYPICVNLLRTGIEALNSALRYTVDKSGLTNRIKRLWRNRLENENSENTHKKNNK